MADGKPGRPKIPEEQRTVKRSVRIDPDAYAVACRIAHYQQVPVQTVLGRVLSRVFGHPKLVNRQESYYAQPKASTLSSVMGVPPDSAGHNLGN